MKRILLKSLGWAIAALILYGLLVDCWDIAGFQDYCGPSLFEGV